MHNQRINIIIGKFAISVFKLKFLRIIFKSSQSIWMGIFNSLGTHAQILGPLSSSLPNLFLIFIRERKSIFEIWYYPVQAKNFRNAYIYLMIFCIIRFLSILLPCQVLTKMILTWHLSGMIPFTHTNKKFCICNVLNGPKRYLSNHRNNSSLNES